MEAEEEAEEAEEEARKKAEEAEARTGRAAGTRATGIGIIILIPIISSPREERAGAAAS